MVDPQTADAPLGHELQQQLVGVGEDGRILHPHRGELGDVEKASVIDLLGRDPPEGQPVRLLVEQGVELVEARAIASGAVQASDRGLQGGPNGFRRLARARAGGA